MHMQKSHRLSSSVLNGTQVLSLFKTKMKKIKILSTFVFTRQPIQNRNDPRPINTQKKVTKNRKICNKKKYLQNGRVSRKPYLQVKERFSSENFPTER